MYEIRHAGSKGFGLFAKRRVPRGTRILAESPTITVRSDREIFPKLSRISQDNRDYIRQLSINTVGKPPILGWTEAAWHVGKGSLLNRNRVFSIGEYRTSLAAFRNNSFNIGDGTRAIFRDICRINHSCLPNAQGNFNSAIGSFTIHAVRSIDPEEEITISYLDEHGAVKDIRQAQLYQGYGFECGCLACDTSTPRGQESEDRRRELRKKLVEFAEATSQRAVRDEKGELELLMMLIRMFELDGLAGRELATM
jgi:hypothetical protein